MLLSGRPGPFLFGDYRVVDRWSEGKESGFFSAVHLATGHPVLLRFLPRDVADDRARWAVLARLPEIRDRRVMRLLPDQGVGKVPVPGAGSVVRAVVGRSSADCGSLPVAEACRVIGLAALGLLAVHRAGRSHGDVCPRSIWCCTDGRVALRIDGDTDLRPPNFTLPDQAEGLLRRKLHGPRVTQAGKAPDRLTDIYALGCTLYETIAGQVPFPVAMPRANCCGTPAHR